MKELFRKYVNRETVTYIIFGVLTTLVNYIIYYGLRLLRVDYKIAEVAAWIGGVLFAFFTNKRYVFESRDYSPKVLLTEFWKFTAGRLITFLIGVVLVPLETVNFSRMSQRTASHDPKGVSDIVKQSAELVAGNADPENQVRLSGSVCRAPVFRETPLGRRVCDVMLAVRRRYGRADFVPVILWGENAVRAGALVPGERICCTGRFQSREDVKRLPEGEETRVAFEVSAAGLCPAD